MLSYSKPFWILLGIIIISTPSIYADDTYEKEIEFATSVEEILSNLRAAEDNFNYGNLHTAKIMMEFPLLESYPKFSEQLDKFPEYQAKLELILHSVKNANMEMTSEDLKYEIKFVEKVLREGEDLVIVESLQNQSSFKLKVAMEMIKRATEKISSVEDMDELDSLISLMQGKYLIKDAKLIIYKLAVPSN